MIVKNEQDILETSLESISFIADEIIIVDTGSTDNTVDIAKKFTNNIKYFDWIDDFSKARNFCSSFATQKYILRWDADFVLDHKDRDKLIELKSNNFYNKDLVHLRWNIEFGDDGYPIRSMANYFFYKKDKFHWESPIHNKLTPNNSNTNISEIYIPEISVDHFKDRNKKAHRYIQTQKILEKTLESDPNNIRLQINLIESYIFDNKIQKAWQNIDLIYNKLKDPEQIILICEYITKVSILQQNTIQGIDMITKLEKKHNINDFRINLCTADLYLQNGEIEKSKKIYNKHINSNCNENLLLLNYERYIVHAYLMLGFIYLNDNNHKLAKKHLEIAKQKTHLIDTKLQINKYI
jgi:glycosyltransferase involved in cell wall biosynthesis